MTSHRIASFFSDKHIILPLLGIILLLSITWIYAVAMFGLISDHIILHTNLYHEIDVLGSRGNIYALLWTWCILLAGNGVLAYALYARKPLWAYVLLYAALPVAFVSFLYIRSLVLINL